MIYILGVVVLVELVILLGILIVYWLDYTNSYIHCHVDSKPCKCNISKGNYKQIVDAIEGLGEEDKKVDE